MSLHDQHLTPDHPIAAHLPQPRFVALAGEAVTDESIAIPRVVKRILGAGERALDGPMVELQNVTQATSATVEIAHQDTPYYYNPREGKVEQLRRWGAHVATLTTAISIAPEGEYG